MDGRSFAIWGAGLDSHPQYPYCTSRLRTAVLDEPSPLPASHGCVPRMPVRAFRGILENGDGRVGSYRCGACVDCNVCALFFCVCLVEQKGVHDRHGCDGNFKHHHRDVTMLFPPPPALPAARAARGRVWLVCGCGLSPGVFFRWAWDPSLGMYFYL